MELRMAVTGGALWTMAIALVALGAAALAGTPHRPGERGPSLVFACRADNDLFRVATASGLACARVATPAEAVAKAPIGGAVLLLADGYPTRTTVVPPRVLDAAAERKLRLYVEFPAALPGLTLGAPRATQWERAVVASPAFGPTLKRLRILAIHDCRFVPTAAAKAHIVVGRVAGFDTAVYGLPEQVFPILFEHPRGDILVATTKLSQFVTARYAPAEAWRAVWAMVLGWLRGGGAVPELRWTPTVRPSFAADEGLPSDVERRALRRGLAWFWRSRLLVHPPSGGKRYHMQHHERVAPAPPPEWPVGDGTHGLLEGFSSSIRVDGSQPVRYQLRNDCNGESAMAFASGGALEKGERDLAVARNLLDFIYVRSPLAQGPRADPKSPSYGLVGWTAGAGPRNTYYGDDNARSMLGTLAAAALLDTDRWDEPLLRCLLANLRTAGRHGFRGNALNDAALQRHGWRHYHRAATVNPWPHYEAYLWACFLWAYRHTGCTPFLAKATTALRMTMAAYPGRWRWTNGMQQERARMLLPLAWLVRLDDTAEHRAWLQRIATDLLAFQHASGALQERLGPPGRGSFVPPPSNAAYGTNEASLLQQNGDPVADLLYTSNFAFLGLHEAAAATGDRLYADAEGRLAAFLCRIQVRSEAHPELDGAWFRAFDYRRWDYWGSNADAGWGAWSIETGWTQAWIVAVLALRQTNASLWSLTARSRIKTHLARLLPLMLPEGEPAQRPLEHLALGRPVALATPFDRRYPAGGRAALTDGIQAGTHHTHPAWQGYWQHGLDATIDLGHVATVRTLSSGYLQSTAVGIFLPTRVEYAVSTDGTAFRVVAAVSPRVSAREPGPLRRGLAATIPPTKARYIRVRAANVGVIPSWHPAAGKKAWLFVDEIVVR